MLIGVTGGIGAGKSLVLEFLKSEHNAKIIMADDVAKELMLPGTECFNRVVDYFGTEILSVKNDSDLNNEEKIIDNQKLGAIVFSDSEKLAVLNSIVHPEVKKEIINRVNSFYRADTNALIIVEAALLIEAGYKDICDEIWLITSDKETRIKRLVEFRNYTREKSLVVMKKQLPDEEFLKHADFIIDNSGDFEATKKQIEIHLKDIIHD